MQLPKNLSALVEPAYEAFMRRTITFPCPVSCAYHPVPPNPLKPAGQGAPLARYLGTHALRSRLRKQIAAAVLDLSRNEHMPHDFCSLVGMEGRLLKSCEENKPRIL